MARRRMVCDWKGQADPSHGRWVANVAVLTRGGLINPRFCSSAAAALFHFAVNLECFGQSHARGREQAEQELVAFAELREVALRLLESASLSGRRFCLSFRRGTILENGLNLSRFSLMARLTAALSQPIFFWIVALLRFWF